MISDEEFQAGAIALCSSGEDNSGGWRWLEAAEDCFGADVCFHDVNKCMQICSSIR